MNLHCFCSLVLTSFRILLMSASRTASAWPVVEQSTTLSPDFLQGNLPPNDSIPTVGAQNSQIVGKSKSKRMMPSISREVKNIMHLIHFQTIEHLHPVETATKIVEEFLQDMALIVKNEYSRTPELLDFSWQQGQLRLNFKCIGDTVPWALVERIANQLWEGACLQFTELFEFIYMNSDHSIGLRVWLELTSRSSDGSNDLDREETPGVTSPSKIGCVHLQALAARIHDTILGVATACDRIVVSPTSAVHARAILGGLRRHNPTP